MLISIVMVAMMKTNSPIIRGLPATHGDGRAASIELQVPEKIFSLVAPVYIVIISEHQQCVYCRQIVKEWNRYNSHHHSPDCYSAEGALEKDNGELTTEDISPQAALDHQHRLHQQLQHQQ